MLKATRLTSLGRLMDATRLIQKTLLPAPASRPQTRRSVPPVAANDPQPPRPPAARAGLKTPLEVLTPVKPTSPAGEKPAGAQTERIAKATATLGEPQAHSADTVRPAQPASFTESSFRFAGQPYPYRLYIPATPADLPAGTLRPLIVLLHGCSQDARDFAQGTAMNELADKHQCLVLYPEQTSRANSGRCWNWFEPDHQKRGRGEPGMIAGLTRQMLASHGGDPARVYIAGLSAGGAMASLVAGLYPDVFTALGVHSGLPAGAAQDMISAFGAMRNGAVGQDAQPLPTIVFHGSADKTVHPDNGENISQAALAALNGAGIALVKTHSTRGAKTSRSTQRTTYRAGDGITYVEHWNVDSGPHAWSGGDSAGSYTDPQGPSASAAMMDFFLQHQKPPEAA
ncbi:MAG: PHB depolymerase family esterase [Comamonadaceae bacterium]|nr:MAG: PHB depolymerase family esterase [Comamonadaceae bacterium]